MTAFLEGVHYIKTAGMVLNGSTMHILIIIANSRKTITETTRSQVIDSVLVIMLVLLISNLSSYV